jgi:hypothetical protein
MGFPAGIYFSNCKTGTNLLSSAPSDKNVMDTCRASSVHATWVVMEAPYPERRRIVSLWCPKATVIEDAQMIVDYSILGVASTARHEEIMQAHRRLLRKYHPDKPENWNSPEALKIIQEINEARTILSNPARRREYDSRRTATIPKTAPPDSSDASNALFHLRHATPNVIESTIVSWIINALKDERNVDLRNPGDAMALTRVADAATKARSALEAADECVLDLPFITTDCRGPIHFRRVLLRSTLEYALTCSADQSPSQSPNAARSTT